MLVEPLVGRGDNAVGLPIAATRRRSFGPQKRVAFALEYDDLRPGGVAVGFFVAADGELGDVGDERAAADLHHRRPIAHAAAFARYQIKVVDVGDEVHVPEALLMNRPFAGKIILLAVEPVAEEMRAIKYEVVVVEKIHHQRCRGEGDKARRAVAAAVVVPVPSVERNAEEASSLPFEAPLGAALLPDLR